MVANEKFGVSLVFLPLCLSFWLFFLVLLSMLFLYFVYLIFSLWCVVEIFFSGKVKRILYEFCVWMPNAFCVSLVFCYHSAKQSAYSIWCDCCSFYTLSSQVWPLECILDFLITPFILLKFVLCLLFYFVSSLPPFPKFVFLCNLCWSYSTVWFLFDWPSPSP